MCYKNFIQQYIILIYGWLNITCHALFFLIGVNWKIQQQQLQQQEQKKTKQKQTKKKNSIAMVQE